MALHVTKEMILACTVGQITDEFNTPGVSIEDVLMFELAFKKALMAKAPKDSYIYFENLDGRIYYGDRWPRNYEMFQNEFLFK